MFTVRKENGTGRLKTLHRNLLLPVGIIRDNPIPRKPRKLIPAPRKTSKTKDPEYNTQTSYSEEELEWGKQFIRNEEQEHSDPSVTDDHHVHSSDEKRAEIDGDANSYKSTVDVEEVIISNRSVSDEEIVQDQHLDSSSPITTDSENMESVSELRRSTRQHRPPLRFRKG